MKRAASVVVLVLVAIGATAGTAWARGDGWQPVNNQPFSFDACGTSTDWAFPMDKEYLRTSTDEQGIVHVQLTGALKVVVTNEATGQAVTVNASGPAKNAEIFPNGDFLFQGTGHQIVGFTPEQSAETGLPTLFEHHGPLQILFASDGSATVVQIEGPITDLCPFIT
jgi:hypothetical protein